MLEGHYGDLVEEIILVWNNPDLLDSTNGGKAEPGRNLVTFDCDYPCNDKCRIWYPWQDGFQNSLFNHYQSILFPNQKSFFLMTMVLSQSYMQ